MLRDLVLEGGGVKGIGLAGAVITLDTAGYHFPRIAGTSAGAIAAALIAALNARKQHLSDLQGILDSVDYPKFMSGSKVRAAANLLVHQGLYDGDYLVSWLGDALKQIGATKFGDLRDDDPGADKTLSDSQKYSLVVHTSDISRGRLVRLPWDYPMYGNQDVDDIDIVSAVRASMAIPFFFEPVKLKAPACTVNGVECAEGDVTWVDGGMLSNFPVEVFDRSDGAPSRWDTLGIKLSAKDTSISSTHGTSNLLGESVACLQTMLDNADRYYVTPDKAARTIFVDNAGIKATDFHLDQAARTKLYDNGVQSAQGWMAAQASPPVVPHARSCGVSSVPQESLEVRLSWSPNDAGGLTGWLEVRNTGDSVVRLENKPGLRPLGVDGAPLATECIVTLELRLPGYVDVPSGGVARAPVGWAGWNGPAASGQVEVTFADLTYVVEVDGPAQPAGHGPGTNLWSNWFELVP